MGGPSSTYSYFFYCPLCSHLGACSHFWSIGLISQFLDYSQTVGLLGRVISSSQGHRTTQTQKNTHTSNIHALSEIRTNAPGFQAAKTVHASTVTGTCSYRETKMHTQF
jgi:hypothetical protein